MEKNVKMEVLEGGRGGKRGRGGKERKEEERTTQGVEEKIADMERILK